MLLRLIRQREGFSQTEVEEFQKAYEAHDTNDSNGVDVVELGGVLSGSFNCEWRYDTCDALQPCSSFVVLVASMENHPKQWGSLSLLKPQNPWERREDASKARNYVVIRDFLKALETTTAIKRCKISCTFLQRLFSFWLATSRRLHFMVVSRSFKSRHFTVVGSQVLWFGGRCVCGRCRFGTSGGWIGTLESLSFVAVVVSRAV